MLNSYIHTWLGYLRIVHPLINESDQVFVYYKSVCLNHLAGLLNP